jgi:hypothetical protein
MPLHFIFPPLYNSLMWKIIILWKESHFTIPVLIWWLVWWLWITIFLFGNHSTSFWSLIVTFPLKSTRLLNMPILCLGLCFLKSHINFNITYVLGVDNWSKVHTNLVALCLDFDKDIEACRKKWSSIYND